MEHLTVTLIQANLEWENKAANLRHLNTLIEPLRTSTDLIVLPEMFTTGFSMNPQELAEPVNGPTLQWMQACASKRNCVVTGSFIAQENGRYYNRLLWVQADGSYSFYDKRHLFALGSEHQHYSAGTQRPLMEVKGWKVLPLICYDLRFPAWSRNTDMYDLLLYVANWPQVRRNAWNTLLAARAIENQSYTIGVNRVGADGNGVPHSGDSSVYDYAGEQVIHIAHAEGAYTVDLDASGQRHFREKLPFLKDRDKLEIEV
jgi:predicted amidohydrolase